MSVVDASVVAKCYLSEKDSQAALEWMNRQAQITAPELIRVEVASSLCKRVRMGQMKAEDAETRCVHWQRSLENGAVQLIPNAALYMRATVYALKLLHPLPDCFYIATAALLETTLVTADKRLAESARSAGIKTMLFTSET